MRATNRKPLEFKKAKSRKPSARPAPIEQRHKEFLAFVANGHSIGDAAAMVGATRAAYEKWRDRVEGFRGAVELARESHRRDIACGFHGADAYARSLLDAIQRDESLAPALRFRASKTILTRKGKKDWLPEPIPANVEPLAPYDDEPSETLEHALVFHPHRREGTPASQPIDGLLVSHLQTPRESESASGATESCSHGQSESASVARGSQSNRIQAPKAAAEASVSNLVPQAPQASAPKASAANSTPEARSREPETVRAPASTPNPDIPDKPNTAPAVANSMSNQQDPPTKTAPRSTSEFFRNPDFQASAPKASAVNLAPEAGSREPEAALSQQWLSNHFLHQHESPKAFEKLLANHILAYQPANPSEELLVFRITQKAWLLRRVETWERVIADSRVAKIREKHPNAAAPACIAMSLLEVKESNQTRFYERTAKLRKEHEDALDRLESKLFAVQQRRENRLLRVQLTKPSAILTSRNTMPPPASKPINCQMAKKGVA